MSTDPAGVMGSRLLLDVTYTRLQRRAVGITRTVRRLAEELPQVVPSSTQISTVAFDGGGFRQAEEDAVAASALASHGVPAGLMYGLATGVAKPAIERLMGLPWAWVSRPWEIASRRAFSGAAPRGAALQVGRGDVLLLFDAAWNYPVWPAVAQARSRGASAIVLLQDLMPLQAPQFCVPWVRGAFRAWLGGAIEGADAIVCNSASTLAALHEYADGEGWRLPPAGHVRLGCDPAPLNDGRVREGIRAFLRDGRCYATVGSIEPKKNTAVLLDAFESLWDEGRAYPLLVLGRGTPECASVAARMRRLANAGLPLLWVDDAVDAEVAYVYLHASALVLPSLFEGFGLPLVEARAAGCSVLASDIPVFRELADEGVGFFDAASTVSLARTVHAHAEGMLKLSRARQVAFGWRDCARQCLERTAALLSVASKSGGDAGVSSPATGAGVHP